MVWASHCGSAGARTCRRELQDRLSYLRSEPPRRTRYHPASLSISYTNQGTPYIVIAYALRLPAVYDDCYVPDGVRGPHGREGPATVGSIFADDFSVLEGIGTRYRRSPAHEDRARIRIAADTNRVFAQANCAALARTVVNFEPCFAEQGIANNYHKRDQEADHAKAQH